MTNLVGRAVSTTAVIGGGALAASGIAGAIGSPDDSEAADLTVAVAGGVGLAAGATALATTGRVGTVARVVGIGATALAGVAALVGFVGGTRRHEAPVAESSPIPNPTPGPAPTTPTATRPGIAPSEELKPTTPATPSTTPAPVPTPTPTDPAPKPVPLTPKQRYEAAMAEGRVRVDTVPDTAASLGGSEALLTGIHPRYAKVFRQALNERITPQVPVTGAADWARVATSVDVDRNGAVTFDERMASGHMRAHSIATYSAGVDELLRASSDTSAAARLRVGTRLLEQWNVSEHPGQHPVDPYMLAQTLLDDAGIARRPDDTADWRRLARHLEAKLESYRA